MINKGILRGYMCKTNCKHIFKISAYSAAEGYSAVCVKCGTEIIVGHETSKIDSADKKNKVLA